MCVEQLLRPLCCVGVAIRTAPHRPGTLGSEKAKASPSVTGSGIPEVPALPCLTLMPLPAAEPEVRLDGSGWAGGAEGAKVMAQLRLLPGPCLRCWLWVWSGPRPACLCLAPSPWHCLRICLSVQESKATCYSPPCVPNTWALGGLSAHVHLRPWGSAQPLVQTGRVGGPCRSCPGKTPPQEFLRDSP